MVTPAAQPPVNEDRDSAAATKQAASPDMPAATPSDAPAEAVQLMQQAQQEGIQRQQGQPQPQMVDPTLPPANLRPKVTPVAGAVAPLDANKLAQESGLPPKENTMPTAPPTGAPTEPPQETSRQTKLAAACERAFLRIQELPGTNYSHRGYCADCGWQTMQHSKENAYDVTIKHVMSHWRKVASQI